MKAIGIDLGTTTISGVIINDGGICHARTVKNEGILPGSAVWEKIQDPEIILRQAKELLRQLLEMAPETEAIGITGQQHGILYLDRKGKAVSPLYTWQDQRGDQPREEGGSYAGEIRQRTGYAVAAGYGLVTHYYQTKNGLVPPEAVGFCTICDYLAMDLCGLTRPRLNCSHAAGLGLYDLERERFDLQAIERLGMDPALIPEVTGERLLGKTESGIPVSVAIGDNQASFIGATWGAAEGVLLNVGTGSQVSIYSPRLLNCPGLETRPFPEGGCLLVGATLCGGRAYAMLEEFFRKTVELVTGQSQDCYPAMGRLLEEEGIAPNCPVFVPTFAGTRQDPDLRGSITGISVFNMTPRHWIGGMLQGMTEELWQLYYCYGKDHPGQSPRLFGAGNGLRKNRTLCALLEERFGSSLTLSAGQEEAACGAAIFAARGMRQST